MLENVFDQLEEINSLIAKLVKIINDEQQNGGVRMDVFLDTQKTIFKVEKVIRDLNYEFNRIEDLRKCFEMIREVYHKLVVEKLNNIDIEQFQKEEQTQQQQEENSN